MRGRLAEWVEQRITAIREANQRGDAAEGERLLASLHEQGVVIISTPHGTKWRIRTEWEPLPDPAGTG